MTPINRDDVAKLKAVAPFGKSTRGVAIGDGRAFLKDGSRLVGADANSVIYRVAGAGAAKQRLQPWKRTTIPVSSRSTRAGTS